MAVPKSVTKVNKDGVTYISSVDRAQYTLQELTRAALRDVGKFVCSTFRRNFYSSFRRKKYKVGRYTQYWVRKRECDLIVGLKTNAFYGGFQEIGSSKTKRLGLLEKTVKSNIPKIIEIESKYLSALESEAKALAMISESEYEGGADS